MIAVTLRQWSKADTAALAAATILRETYGERVGGNNEPQQVIDQVVAFIDREESHFEPDYSPPDLATKAGACAANENAGPTLPRRSGTAASILRIFRHIRYEAHEALAAPDRFGLGTDRRNVRTPLHERPTAQTLSTIGE